MTKNKKIFPKHDPSTGSINKLILKIPGVGKYLSRAYLWKYLTWNFMLVGASGMILSFLLYEGLFRILLFNYWGGTFLGMLITTLLVFLWNYLWNRHWSLSIDSQLLSMKKGELNNLKLKCQVLLGSKFTADGERISE